MGAQTGRVGVFARILLSPKELAGFEQPGIYAARVLNGAQWGASKMFLWNASITRHAILRFELLLAMQLKTLPPNAVPWRSRTSLDAVWAAVLRPPAQIDSA